MHADTNVTFPAITCRIVTFIWGRWQRESIQDLATDISDGAVASLRFVVVKVYGLAIHRHTSQKEPVTNVHQRLPGLVEAQVI